MPTCLVSIPLRYMHSPCELVHLKDLDNCAKLIAKTVEKLDLVLVLFLFKSMKFVCEHKFEVLSAHKKYELYLKGAALT